MLTAKYENKTIYVHNYSTEFLKKASNEKKLYCPDCGDTLTFKEYKSKQSHFSHISKDCSYPFREPESIEHETGKNAIFEWISSQFSKNDCFVERKIDKTNQRSDVFVESIFSAFEFQCSPIQAKTWNERHSLYKSANVNNYWILGYSMHKYYSTSNRFTHKLNQLEKELLKKYNKIIYFDVLTNQFVFLYIEDHFKNYSVGREFFFRPNEILFKENAIVSKYDYFIEIQDKRRNFSFSELKKAKQTDNFIKSFKDNSIKVKKLATKKQINYIKFLLYQKNKKIPYKLHGLLQEEADAIIKELKKN